MSCFKLKRTTNCIAIAVALALCSNAGAQDAYEYRPIDPPGSAFSQAFGINERGEAVGTAQSLDGAAVGFSYAVRKDQFLLIEGVPGYEAGTAILGNSDSGSLVGSVDDTVTQRVSGLLIGPGGTVTTFDHPDAPSQTQARGINSRGLITGFRDFDGPLPVAGAFIYDSKRDVFTDIVPSLFTIAQGINSRGDVVGSAIFFSEDDPCNPGAPPGGNVRYGWLRTADGHVRYFTVNGLRTSARGITDAGLITGFTQDLITGATEGFVTHIEAAECQDVAVGSSDLLVYPGATATFPQAIANSGMVVGSYNDAGGTTRSFVAIPD